MNKNLDLIIVRENIDIREAMETIDKGGLKIVFVVDKDKKLLGSVTDGDVRRALLAGCDFQLPVSKIMNRNPITASKDFFIEQLLDKMVKSGIQSIPIVSCNNIIEDVVLLSELKTIPLSSPDITHKEIQLIRQVLSTPTLSIGPEVEKFEKQLSDYIGVKYAVAVNSGTSGLHLCVRSLGISDGDEVITTPFSFIASANCMLFERAKPVFVDIDPETLCIDPGKIEEKITPKTKAILIVHVFGHPCDMERIMAIAAKHGLRVIEDACEAIGAEFNGRKVGSFGDCAVLAFYPNKQITTAEGGMILTNNAEIAKLCKSMRNQGRSENGSWLSHVRLGYNYRMSELSAAMGVAQMERIGAILEKRRKVADLYNKKLKDLKGIRLPYKQDWGMVSWFVYVVMLENDVNRLAYRQSVMDNLRIRGVSCSNYFPPIHLEPFYVEMFNYRTGDFPVTERISASTIALPFFNNIEEDQIDYVRQALKDSISQALIESK